MDTSHSYFLCLLLFLVTLDPPQASRNKLQFTAIHGLRQILVVSLLVFKPFSGKLTQKLKYSFPIDVSTHTVYYTAVFKTHSEMLTQNLD